MRRRKTFIPYEITHYPARLPLTQREQSARPGLSSQRDLSTTRPMLGDGVSTNASTTKPAAVATLCQRVVVRSPRLPMSARSASTRRLIWPEPLASCPTGRKPAGKTHYSIISVCPTPYTLSTYPLYFIKYSQSVFESFDGKRFVRTLIHVPIKPMG